jgi:hypothetical protein
MERLFLPLPNYHSAMVKHTYEPHSEKIAGVDDIDGPCSL